MPWSVNKCHVVHTDMESANSVSVCDILFHLEFRLFYAAPGVPCLCDSSNKRCDVYLRAAFMTAFVVHPEAIIRVWLLKDRSY